MKALDAHNSSFSICSGITALHTLDAYARYIFLSDEIVTLCNDELCVERSLPEALLQALRLPTASVEC
jgi:hypothetical protein